jgi:hypothetical protein
VFGETEDNPDMFPDVLVGRLPVLTSSDVGIVVNKIVRYESEPASGYLKSMLLPAGVLKDNPPNELHDGTLANQGIARMTPTGWNVRKLYERDGNLSQASCVAAFDSGYALGHFTGHANWDEVEVNVANPTYYYYQYSDAMAASNGDSIGIYVVQGCDVGAPDYANRDCGSLAEALLLSPAGGAVADIAASRYESYQPTPHGADWSANECLDTAFFHNVLVEGEPELGAAVAASKAAFVCMVGGWRWRWAEYEWTTYGDPALNVWTDVPPALTLGYPGSIQSGPQTYRVIVHTGGNALENATVCLWKGTEVYAVGYTNSSGYVDLTIDPTSVGTMYVTVTKQNYLPYEGTCAVQSGLPPAPTPTAPPNGGTVGTTTPTLQVQSISGADQYDFRVYQGGSPVAQGAPATNSWTVSPALTNGQTYTWKCRAHNSSGWGLYCAEWSFTVSVSGPPNPPQPIAPPNGGTVNTLRPTLKVQPVPGALIYRYLVTHRGMYVRDATVPTDTWKLDIDLQNGFIYDWVCRCSTAQGRSEWGPSWSFTVDISGPPPSPEDWPMFHNDAAHCGYTSEAVNPPYELAWTYSCQSGFIPYMAPIVVKRNLFFSADNSGILDGYLYCIDTAGNFRWLWNYGGDDALVTPCFANGKLYSGCRSGTGTRGMFIHDSSDGGFLWTNQPFPAYPNYGGINTPQVVDGNYWFTHCDYPPGSGAWESLYCLNASTGARLWAYAQSSWSWNWAGPATDAGYVYFTGPDGVYRFAENGGSPAICNLSAEYATSHVCISGGKIYVCRSNSIYCINEAAMSVAWSAMISGCSGSPAVGNGSVFFAAGDSLFALDAATGARKSGWPRYLAQTGSPGVSTPSVAGNVVFCCSNTSGHFYALDATTGAQLCDYSFGGQTHCMMAPAIAGGKIYVAATDGRILAFRHGSPVTKDVAVLDIQQPGGTIDSGSAVVPVAHVRNYWNQAATFDATFRIGTWSNTRSKTLAAGAADTVGFPAWTAQPRGSLAVKCTVAFSGDETPGNNYQTGTVDVRVRDVGVVRLVAPSGTIDSGSIVTPACSVYNYGTATESYNVRMKIGSFYDEIATLNHNAGQRLYVTFPSWFVLQRGAQTAKCSTELAGDMKPGNDKQSGAVTVVIRDAGCTWLGAPCGTVDSGATVAPACSVHNYGSAASTYTVRMKIGSAYSQVLTVTNQIPGASTYLTFPNWTALQRGTNTVSCSTELSGDIKGYNDRRSTYVLVAVRDVGISLIVAPTGTLDSGTVVAPRAVAQNSGTSYEVFNVVLRIGSSYSQTVSESLTPGVADTVLFPDWTASPLGMLPVSCSTTLSGDFVPGNNRRLDSVRVTPPAGIRESESQFSLPRYFALQEVHPNPVADLARVSYDLPVPCYNRIAVFDIHGREVARLVSALESPGRYELAWSRTGLNGGRLPSGVYFCRMRADCFCAVRKFLLLQ